MTLGRGCSFLLHLTCEKSPFYLSKIQAQSDLFPERRITEKLSQKAEIRGKSSFFLAELTTAKSGLSQPLVAPRELQEGVQAGKRCLKAALGLGLPHPWWPLCPHMSPRVSTLPKRPTSAGTNPCQREGPSLSKPGKGQCPEIPELGLPRTAL